LQAHGIVAEYITYPRVTLTSASRLCVRHSPPGDSSQHTLTLLDPHASPKEDETPATGQLAQIYDVDQRSLRNEWEFAHPIKHWVWLDADTLAVVTEEDVFHWTMKRTRPRWQFSRHERLCSMEVIGYHRDANHMWMALSALGLEQLICDIVFATVIDDDRPHSLLGVCRSGKVLSISICPDALWQYLSHHPASLSLSQRVLQLIGEVPPRWTAVLVE
ncbi:hypothetical protein JD844_012867, partial [Phrynosoma platyrhinos]